MLIDKNTCRWYTVIAKGKIYFTKAGIKNEVNLQLAEEEYDKALAAYEKLGEEANKALEKLIAAMREGEQALIKLEENFSDDIKSELTANAAEIEAKLNAAKTEFFAEFEAAHKDDIDAMEADLLARKEALKESIKTY